MGRPGLEWWKQRRQDEGSEVRAGTDRTVPTRPGCRGRGWGGQDGANRPGVVRPGLGWQGHCQQARGGEARAKADSTAPTGLKR